MQILATHNLLNCIDFYRLQRLKPRLLREEILMVLICVISYNHREAVVIV